MLDTKRPDIAIGHIPGEEPVGVFPNDTRSQQEEQREERYQEAALPHHEDVRTRKREMEEKWLDQEEDQALLIYLPLGSRPSFCRVLEREQCDISCEFTKVGKDSHY